MNTHPNHPSIDLYMEPEIAEDTDDEDDDEYDEDDDEYDDDDDGDGDDSGDEGERMDLD